jgi:hypothetical protein
MNNDNGDVQNTQPPLGTHFESNHFGKFISFIFIFHLITLERFISCVFIV